MSVADDARRISIGISQNAELCLGQHTPSGRFDPQIDVKVDLHKNIDYATARVYEQYYTERHSTIDRTNTKANQQTHLGILEQIVAGWPLKKSVKI